jgi:hypothetical protein
MRVAKYEKEKGNFIEAIKYLEEVKGHNGPVSTS